MLASLPVVAAARRPATCAPTEATAGETANRPLCGPMQLDPRPPLAATGDRTRGQAASLRDRVLPLHLTRPSAPSALATRPAVISVLRMGRRRPICSWWATRTTAARVPSGTNSLFGRETRIEQRARGLAATTSCHAVAGSDCALPPHGAGRAERGSARASGITSAGWASPGLHWAVWSSDGPLCRSARIPPL